MAKHSNPWTRREVDRVFEKQAEYERRKDQLARKAAEDLQRDQWLTKKSRRVFPNDFSAKEGRWRRDRLRQVAGARFEAREIPRRLSRLKLEKEREIIKRGVLEGAIQIHETVDGYEIDTPRQKVEEYILRDPSYTNYLPKPTDLMEGRFLLGTVHDLSRVQGKLVRDSLIEEIQPKDTSDYMLIDLAVSNYFRTMHACKLERDCLLNAVDYRYEMFEIVVDGLQPYIHDCQNQLLKVVRALKAGKQAEHSSTFTYETYSRTRINVEKWGLPLLLALAEITEKKETQIDIDEIKQTMTKFVDNSTPETIPNSCIGYVLRHYGFTDKIHLTEGNRYNVDRKRVLKLLNEDLKT